MADRPGPKVYSIAAHRGFADALVAGLVPRYADRELGLAFTGQWYEVGTPSHIAPTEEALRGG